MVSSKIKYALFFALFLAMLGVEFVLVHDDPYAAASAGSPNKEVIPTGNVISGEAGGLGGSLLAFLLVIFVIVSIYLILKRKKMRMLEHDAPAYVSLLLRLLLGISLIIFGLNVEQSALGYIFAMAKIIAGIMIILGILTKPVAYLAFFYSLSLLAGKADLLSSVLLIGISIAIFLLGPGTYSIDADIHMKRK